MFWVCLVLLVSRANSVAGHCHKSFSGFLHLADLYWRGRDVSSGGDFARAIADALVQPEVLDFCPLARIAAQAVTAHTALRLSRPFANELPAGALRARYDAEVWAYARNHTLQALALLNTAPVEQSLAAEFGGGAQQRLIEMLNSSLERVAAALEVTDIIPVGNPGQHLAVAGTTANAEDSWPHPRNFFDAAVTDQRWREVWLPAILGDAGPFWYLTSLSATDSEARETLASQRRQEMVAEELEANLYPVFLKAVKLLADLQRQGIIHAWWPSSSTLLAFLRHGRLIGRFADGRRDCVGDDIDTSISLDDIVAAWPRFVLEVAQAFQEQGACKCYLGAHADRIAQSGGVYEQLLCICPMAASEWSDRRIFFVPVGFTRILGGKQPLEMGKCAAFDYEVPCPMDVRLHLQKYPGCVAIPDPSQSTLFLADGCVAWMENGGLTMAHIAELRSRAQWLAESGFLSLEPIWTSSECAELVAKLSIKSM